MTKTWDGFKFPHGLSVFFPAYNDAASLPSLIQATFDVLRKHVKDYEVIVINDGSHDNTGAVLDDLERRYAPHLRVVTHESNRGYGAALRSGFAAATKEFVFYTDGDGQYDPAEMLKLLKRVRPGVGLVNGYKTARQDPWHRIVIGALYNRFARWLFRIRLRDIDCDFRLVRRSLVERAGLQCTSGTVCVELVRKLQMQAPEAVEVPVSHYPRLHGRSQFFRVRSLTTTFVQLWGLYLRLVLWPSVLSLWRRAGWERTAMAGISLIFLLLLASLAARTGVTGDEPANLVSGYLYWQREDTSEGDLGPLIKIAGGWVPHLTGLPIPGVSHQAWKSGSREIALQMMHSMSSQQIERTFFYARLPMLVFPLGCTILLWWWGRRLFSPGAGVLIALAFSLSPNVLGHGALFHNDLAAAFGYLFFWYRAWEFWRQPDAGRAAWMGLAVALGLAAKFSLLILVPIAPIVIAARFLWDRQLATGKFIGPMAAMALTAYLGILAVWQFQVEPWARVPTPVGLYNGVPALMESATEQTRVYMLGQVHPGGHWLYFAVALAAKMPRALLFLVAAGLVASLVALLRRRLCASDVFWLAPAFLYLTLASLVNLRFGVRLVLPSLVFLVLVAGKALQGCAPRSAAAVFPVLLFLWMGSRTAGAWPHYLSFFNEWAGGPDKGLRVLSDSNIDWGQDLPELARWVRQRDIGRIRLAYHGSNNPHAYLDHQRVEMLPVPGQEGHRGGTRFQPEPGYYAISATHLTGHRFEQRFQDYFADFRTMRPVGKAGYSIFVYRVP